MNIVRTSYGEDNQWHLLIGGFSTSGRKEYRLGVISITTNDPYTWFEDNQDIAQDVVNAGEPDPVRETRFDFEDLREKVEEEILWLDDVVDELTHPPISQPRLTAIARRLAEQNRYMLKSWNYLTTKDSVLEE